MKVLVACTTTSNSYISKCLTTLVSIKKFNPKFDYAVYIDGNQPLEFKEFTDKYNIIVKNMEGDQNFKTLKFKGYPLVCCNIFKIHKEVQGIYDYVITVDGDMKGMRPIPENEFTDDYVVSGYGIKRKWCKKTLQTGILCFNVKKCIEYKLYDKLVEYFKKYNYLNRWGSDDFLFGWFVKDNISNMPFKFSHWQYIPHQNFKKYKKIIRTSKNSFKVLDKTKNIPKIYRNKKNFSTLRSAYVLHMVDNYHPWSLSCIKKLNSIYLNVIIKNQIKTWINLSYEIFGESLKKYMRHCYNWVKSPISKIKSRSITVFVNNKGKRNSIGTLRSLIKPRNISSNLFRKIKLLR